MLFFLLQDDISITMMKTEYITAPVTALAFAGDLLLTGEGPCLHLYDVTSTEHLQVHQVLTHANIHGIRTAAAGVEVDCWDVALFGQKTLQLVQIRRTENAIHRKGVLVTPGDQHGECEVHDWIWDVCWLLPDQIQGKAVRQLALALGHNTVVLWDAEAQRSIREVHCQEKCILYCAHFIGSSWSDLMLAAGTVFREVVLWKPCGQKEDQDCVSVLQRITGHQGVIFSVCYHPPTGRLCTASDDRSVRLWQVAGPLQQVLDTGEAIVSPTGVATAGEFELVFEVYGHGSRVWDVQLTQDYIISVGEVFDAQCIVWNMQGEIAKTFRGHKGNSIWSLAVCEKQGLVATGGGDTSIRLWELPGSVTCQSEAVGTSSTLNLPLSLDDFPRSLASCLAHLFLVVTDQGSLYSYNTATCQWSLVLQDPIYRSYSLLEVSAGGMVAMGSLAGTIKVFFISAPNACWESAVYDGKVLSLTWMGQNADSTVSSLGHLLSCGPEGEVIWWTTHTAAEAAITVQKTATFQLPYSRQRWLTCALLSPKDSTLVCGDRRGSLHCYRKQDGDEPTQPVQSLIGIHGKTGVTSLQIHRSHVYSTGRDGHYRQFQLGATGLHLLKNNRVYKGFDWLEKLTFSEDGEMLALGFHTSNFVVWSLSANEPLLQVQCGGGHRAWGILPSASQGALFAYIKARAVQLTKGPSISSSKRLILKDSLHGREITCLKFLGWTNNEGAPYAICATSSEDTTINIVALKHKPVSDLVVLDTIQDHISSVRCLTVCPQLNTSGSSQCASSPKLLFSGGGRAQLKCYRVSVSSHCDSGGVHKGKPCSEKHTCTHQNMENITPQDRHLPEVDVSVKETKEPQGYRSVDSPSDTSGSGNNGTLQEKSTGHCCDVPDTEATTSHVTPAVECHIEYLACHNLVERRRRKKKSGAAQLEEEEVEMRYMALTSWQGRQVNPHSAHLFFVAAACSDGFLRLKTILEQSQPGTEPATFSIKGTALKKVPTFTYLGSVLNSTCGITDKVHRRIGLASTSFGRLANRVFLNKDLTTKTKVAVYSAICLSILLYASETWTLYRSHIRMLEQFHMRCLQRILGLMWWHKVPHTEVRRRASIEPIKSLLLQRQLRWAGHIIRMPSNRLPRHILYGELSAGNRNAGGQQKRYKDNLKANLKKCNIKPQSLEKLAEQRSRWREACTAGIASFTTNFDRQCEERRAKRHQPSSHTGGEHTCDTCGRICLLFVYDDSERTIQLFCVSDFHHHCVLSVDHFFTTTTDGSIHTYVISGATDGQIAVWNVTPILSAFLSSVRHSNHHDITEQDTVEAGVKVPHTLSTERTKCQGGMNTSTTKDMQDVNSPVPKVQLKSGCLRKTPKMEMESPDALLKKHPSGVNAISIQRVDSHHYLLASGGDDNSLQITVLAVREDTPNKPVIVATATSSAHSAHAATITGVHVLDGQSILTTSVDQRVNMWKYQLILKPTTQCHLSFLYGKFSHIADIAGLECWNDECGQQHIAVCGHGIQVLSPAHL
ncbi:WDR6 [Branchiostoma lanceolatum]|uniref:tRNA (34-2'-O)-methyltransferase regulator WDR6 n=1 Tax=Branchiostoma lanceolatum TaxID=7740 RepID=A0A8J9ZQT0_BRALA|nr:WDR6 [Branchiostoma lanceolatum]